MSANASTNDLVTSGLLRKGEVARLLVVSQRAVERLVACGRLPKVRILGAVRFRRADVETIIQRGSA